MGQMKRLTMKTQTLKSCCSLSSLHRCRCCDGWMMGSLSLSHSLAHIYTNQVNESYHESRGFKDSPFSMEAACSGSKLLSTFETRCGSAEKRPPSFSMRGRESNQTQKKKKKKQRKQTVPQNFSFSNDPSENVCMYVCMYV